MSGESSAEVERKFELTPEQQLPALDSVATLAGTEEFDLVATYYDTLHFDLTRAHVVLRHRLGGTDAGWHVKLAEADSEHRREHHAPPDAPRPPAALRELVAEPLDGQALIPVARVQNRRRQSELRDGDTLLAYLCDDHVEAVAGDLTQSWREAEVELVDGSPEFLDAVTEVFAAAGVRVSADASKIGRALGGALADDDRSRGGVPSAGAVVLDYVSEQIGVVQAREAGVRLDEPDAVHRSRVATRRLRSALRTFGPVFGKDSSASPLVEGKVPSASRLRRELKWYAAELGAARDAEVLRDGLIAALDALAVPSRAAERGLLTDTLTAEHASAHEGLVASMDTDRYDRLQRELVDFLVARPLSAAANEPAAVELHGLLDKARGRVATHYARALDVPDELRRWHEVRKAAKAVRYGAEALVPVLGERAVAHASLWEAVTDSLGEVQDTVVARETVSRLADEQAAAGHEVGAFAALLAYEAERCRAQLALGRQAVEAALAASL